MRITKTFVAGKNFCWDAISTEEILRNWSPKVFFGLSGFCPMRGDVIENPDHLNIKFFVVSRAAREH